MKTKYMIVSGHHNAEHNHNLMTGNKSLENVAKVQIFGNDFNESKLYLE
jgi:hypothetical protein